MQQPIYQNTVRSLMLTSWGNLLAVTAMVLLTYFKPFGKIKRTKKAAR